MNQIAEGTKYYPLKKFLSQATLILSFDEIEKILGDKLPPSAYQYREWWQDKAHNHSYAWLEAGWSFKSVDFGNTVTFEKM